MLMDVGMPKPFEKFGLVAESLMPKPFEKFGLVAESLIRKSYFQTKILIFKLPISSYDR